MPLDKTSPIRALSPAARLTPLLLLLLVSCTAVAAQLTLSLTCPTNQVPKYQKIEFNLAISGTYTNPFDPDEADVSIHFTTPAGQRLSVPGFWYQPYERRRLTSGDHARDWIYPAAMPGWKARFAPSEPGVYQAVAHLSAHDGTAVSAPFSFQCLPGPGKGFLRVSRKDSRFFEFQEGQPFFAIGQNLAFIGSQQYVTLSKAEEIFPKLSANGANFLRVWTCCEDWAMAIEARKSAFGRSWDWRPPLLPMPGAGDTDRKCLKLSPDKNTLRIDPSHPVALKPSTDYVLAGKVRIERAANLILELDGKSLPLQIGIAKDTEWIEFRHPFKTGPNQSWLPPLSLRSEGQGTAFVADLSLREGAAGPELLWEADINRPVRGYYNPLDCFMLDELVASAEQQGIYLQLCLLTRDLYMSALKDPTDAGYERAIHDARNTLRYAVARWGYSTAVAAWEYWNELDPGLLTDKFYSALGEYLEQVDPFHHLRTTSTWGPSAKDCRHPKLDVADVHFYLRPADKGRLQDEVDAVLERTRWLRDQAPAKPAHLGEFGLANDKWQPTAEMNHSQETFDLHNALWASGLSGASGTAMFWWWERLDQRDFYPQYRPFSRFIADVPWTGGELRPLTASSSEPRVRNVGLRANNRAWLWLFNREASWNKIVVENHPPAPVPKTQLQISDLPAGTYLLRWWDTSTGTANGQDTVATHDGLLQMTTPPFDRDIAVLVTPTASQ